MCACVLIQIDSIDERNGEKKLIETQRDHFSLDFRLVTWTKKPIYELSVLLIMIL